MPSLAALAPKSARKVPSNDDPVLRSQLLNLAEKHPIFFRRPLAALVLSRNRRLPLTAQELDLQLLDGIHVLLFLKLLQLVPPLEAADLRFVWHVLAQSMPGVLTIGGNESLQFFVLSS